MDGLLTSAGLVGATVTVAATTLDDAVWLVPFVGSSSWSWTARTTHATIFVLTLELLAIVSVVVALGVANGVSWWTIDVETQEIWLGSIAALLCWSLAAFFYVKKLLKRRRRRRRQQERGEGESLVDGCSNAITGNPTTDPSNYKSTAGTPSESQTNNNPAPEVEAPPKPLTWNNVGTVISLTFLGALDELSYFPTLILGKIFTPLEVCLGTLLAAILILILVTCCLARIKKIADYLDRIPIYAVIALFATILTAGVIYDLLLMGKED